MARIAFVTYQEMPEGTEDDRLAADVLRHEGATVDFVVWGNGDLSGYDRVVVRSTWDYHHHYADFLRWLDDLEQQQIPVLNPVQTLRWNSRKSYLLDLEKRGIDIVPTAYVHCGQPVDLAAVMGEREWQKAVVKPAVSAAGFETWVTDGTDQARFETLVDLTDVLVQPFMAEVQQEGEWSLLFFNRQFSHAVLKRPAGGDFRVQPHFGGNSQPHSAPESLIQQAQWIVDAVEGDLLYARVDGVARDGRLLLMELELIEPHLFLEFDAAAPMNFARAIRN